VQKKTGKRALRTNYKEGLERRGRGRCGAATSNGARWSSIGRNAQNTGFIERNKKKKGECQLKEKMI